MSDAGIPAEAVEAAARAWHATIPTGDGTFSQRAARAALEAAAPHLKHIRCEDCGKCRVVEGEEWCGYCEYWSCERGEYCADAKQYAL